MDSRRPSISQWTDLLAPSSSPDQQRSSCITSSWAGGARIVCCCGWNWYWRPSYWLHHILKEAVSRCEKKQIWPWEQDLSSEKGRSLRKWNNSHRPLHGTCLLIQLGPGQDFVAPEVACQILPPLPGDVLASAPLTLMRITFFSTKPLQHPSSFPIHGVQGLVVVDKLTGVGISCLTGTSVGWSWIGPALDSTLYNLPF